VLLPDTNQWDEQDPISDIVAAIRTSISPDNLALPQATVSKDAVAQDGPA